MNDNIIVAWFKSKHITTHAIAAFVIGASGAVMTIHPLTRWAAELWMLLPVWLHKIVVIAVGLWSYYHNPNKTPANPSELLASVRQATEKRI